MDSMISGVTLFTSFKQMLFQNELSINLCRIIRMVLFSLQFIQFQYLVHFLLLLIIIMYTTANIYSVKLSIVSQMKNIYTTQNMIISFKCFVSLVSLVLYILLNDTLTFGLNGKFNKAISVIDTLVYVTIGSLLSIRYYTLQAILLTTFQFLFVFAVNSGLENIPEIIQRKIQIEISLVNSSNNKINSDDDTVQLRKDKTQFICTDIQYLLLTFIIQTNYVLSIAAIGLLLCTRYYTLRTLLLTLIQLLLVLNIFEINWRKNHREISLVTSSNNNTNYVDGTIMFSLLNPPPHTLPTGNESYGGGIALVGLLNPPPHTLLNENESYGGGVALFIYVLRFIALQNAAAKLKSRIHLMQYQTPILLNIILLNIICIFILLCIGSILFRTKANKLCTENTIAVFLYLENDETHLLIFIVIYLASFIAIGLLFVSFKNKHLWWCISSIKCFMIDIHIMFITNYKTRVRNLFYTIVYSIVVVY